jgi:hypothetical protein
LPALLSYLLCFTELQAPSVELRLALLNCLHAFLNRMLCFTNVSARFTELLACSTELPALRH